VPGVSAVDLVLDVMSEEQRKQLREELLQGHGEKEIPFDRPGSLTKVIRVASGKGGVGKSSVTANLAVAIAATGNHGRPRSTPTSTATPSRGCSASPSRRRWSRA
jgi:ATP-binding protein involved in chromosome partitioning